MDQALQKFKTTKTSGNTCNTLLLAKRKYVKKVKVTVIIVEHEECASTPPSPIQAGFGLSATTRHTNEGGPLHHAMTSRLGNGTQTTTTPHGLDLAEKGTIGVHPKKKYIRRKPFKTTGTAASNGDHLSCTLPTKKKYIHCKVAVKIVSVDLDGVPVKGKPSTLMGSPTRKQHGKKKSLNFMSRMTKRPTSLLQTLQHSPCPRNGACHQL